MYNVLRFVQDQSMQLQSRLLCYVFFQAEDGIRDLVRSRGLGDVYKRQLHKSIQVMLLVYRNLKCGLRFLLSREILLYGSQTVSYTHLTLPTSDLV